MCGKKVSMLRVAPAVARERLPRIGGVMRQSAGPARNGDQGDLIGESCCRSRRVFGFARTAHPAPRESRFPAPASTERVGRVGDTPCQRRTRTHRYKIVAVQHRTIFVLAPADHRKTEGSCPSGWVKAALSTAGRQKPLPEPNGREPLPRHDRFHASSHRASPRGTPAVTREASRRYPSQTAMVLA